MNPTQSHNRISKVYALVAAALMLPALAYAQNNQGDNQIEALQAQITALQKQVNTLQTQLAAVLSSNVYALNPYVSFDPNPENGVAGPNITFHGANIHITDGLNMGTDDNGGTLSGLGNLIIGYDELNPGPPPQVANRGGSHNLVIGRFHNFTSSAFGGLVAGEGNTISAGIASVTGGGFNTVSGLGASISGGLRNTASGIGAVVIGGGSFVLGTGNTATGNFSVVLGGTDNTASNVDSIVPQPPFP